VVANPIVDVGKVTQSVAMTGQLIDAILDNVLKGLSRKGWRQEGHPAVKNYASAPENAAFRLSRGRVQVDWLFWKQ